MVWKIDVLMLLYMICMKFDRLDVVGMWWLGRLDNVIDMSGMKKLVIVMFCMSVGSVSDYLLMFVVYCECI